VSSHGSGAEDSGAVDFFGNERFELGERLGEGAYGVVYEALDRVRETQVALKVLRQLGPDALFYFKKEFRALSDIQHPNLVRYYELFEERGRWFLTMELVRGGSFVEYVRAGRSPVARDKPRFDEARLREALPQLGAALAALHTTGKVHRDVKPSNVRVTGAGRVVLLDFGLVLDTDARESTRLPRVGTVSFMAPEQVVGTQVGPEADFYAVGAMLYECLTGQHPFVGDAYDVLSEKQMRDPARASDVAPFVPLDLEELCMALLLREPKQRKSAIDALGELAPRVSRPSGALTVRPPGFVGRTRELAALERLVDELDDGQPRVAYVHGESGVGKSALLGELARTIRKARPDAVLLTGRCYERETVPYKAFDGVVDALARHLRGMSDEEVFGVLPPHVELLAQAFPVLSRVPRIRERVARDRPAQERDGGSFARKKAFAALRELLGRLARAAPLLVAIDDIHRADADSLSLLEELLVPPDLPVLFLLFGRAAFGSRADARASTGRREQSAELERLIERTPGFVRLRLGALAEGDARQLAESLLGTRSDAAELSLAIAREAAGQPLFVAALVHFVSQSQDATRSIPTLDEALRASVAALGTTTQTLVSMIALAGAPLSRDVLSRALGLDGSMLQRALDEAMATRWFRVSAGDDGGGIELVHERIREALGARLDAAEKERLHRALAEALSRSSMQAEAAARHWAEAGAHVEVVRFARSAARQAMSTLAFAKAVRLFELALAHVSPVQDEWRAELTEALAEALSYAGRPQEAAERYAEAAALSEPARAPAMRHRAAVEWLSAGDQERGLRELTTLLADLGIQLAGSRGALTFSLLWRSFAAFFRGHRTALRGDEPSPAELLRVDALYTCATALACSNPLAARELQLRHVEAALELAEPYRLARAHAFEALLVLGRTTGKKLLESEELRRARDLAQQTRHPHAAALVELAQALGYWLLGRHTEALRSAEAADTKLREECPGAAWERSTAMQLSLVCRFDAGDLRGLRARLEALELEAAGSATPTPGSVTRFSAFHCLLADEPEQARGLLDRARAQRGAASFDLDAFQLLCAHTDFDLYLGDPNACARVERAWPELSRARWLEAAVVRGPALHLRARAALGSGYLLPHQRERLLQLAERAARMLAREATPGALALASAVRASCAELSGQREEAITQFGEAALACEAAGLLHYTAAAQRRQGTLLGGEEGRTLVVRAERALREQGALDPGRICAVLLGY
jgi:hypothetical protein